MNKPYTKNLFTIRPVFVCGALLFLTTIVIAQHALDANLRVGSGGYNAKRPQVTMSRSIYKVSSTGGMYYNRGAAFKSAEVYDSAIYRRGGRPDVFNPKPKTRPNSRPSALARPTYSTTGRITPSTAGIPVVRSVNRTKTSASLQRSGYSPGRSLNAMQAPTLNLSQKAYSVSGTASSTVRSR